MQRAPAGAPWDGWRHATTRSDKQLDKRYNGCNKMMGWQESASDQCAFELAGEPHIVCWVEGFAAQAS